jgi:hypothetical protein
MKIWFVMKINAKRNHNLVNTANLKDLFRIDKVMN